MENLEPKHSISSDMERGELHFMISGYWPLDAMQAFLIDLDKAAYPLFASGKSVRVLGEMDGFKTQSRETGAAIENQLQNSVKYGLQRVAIIKATALVKSQYRRLSAGIDVGFFDSRFDAIAWLRREHL